MTGSVQKSTLLLQNRGHAEVLKKDPFFREIRNAGAAPLCAWVPRGGFTQVIIHTFSIRPHSLPLYHIEYFSGLGSCFRHSQAQRPARHYKPKHCSCRKVWLWLPSYTLYQLSMLWTYQYTGCWPKSSRLSLSWHWVLGLNQGLSRNASNVSFGHAEHCFLTVWTPKYLCQNLLKMTFLRR